jgi:hypothetical protein
MNATQLKFMSGALTLKGARKMTFEVDTSILPKPVAVPVSKVEPPAEVPQTRPQSGLVPENPPAK